MSRTRTSHRQRSRTTGRNSSRTPKSVQLCWRVRTRRFRSAGPMRLPVRTTCDRRIGLSVSMALLTLPFLASCARQPSHVSQPQSQKKGSQSPVSSDSFGTIRFQGVDHPYRATSSLSDDPHTQSKDPP